MNRVFNKFFITAFLLFSITSNAIGSESEYKNSLVKVELSKKGESAYNINLYTQKRYLEPVKVIKKSDLNYYILLPETKNSASQTSTASTDIRNVSINLYPYAGQEANNGYTKININTTKPINFDLNIKQLNQNSTANKQTTIAKQQSTNATQKPVESKEIQKKNSAFQEPKKSVSPSVAKPISKPAASKHAFKTTSPKTAAENNTKIKKVKKENNTLKTQKKIKTQTKQAEAKKAVSTPPEEKKPAESAKEAGEPTEQVLSAQQPIENPIAQQEEETQQSNNIATDEPQDETLQQEPGSTEDTDSLNNIKFIIKNQVSLIYKLKNKFSNKLAQFNLSLKDFIFMISASFFTFLFMLFILTKRQHANVKLKNKKDLLGEEHNIKKSTSSPKRKNNGEYFVFDKNIRQTRLNTAQNTKRNYELSCYDPDLRINYKKNDNKTPEIHDSNSEYDIIQKILKEDSLLEFEPQNEKPAAQKPDIAANPLINKKTTAPQKQNPTIQNIKKEVQTTKNKAEESQPQILSSVEIAPERGFMCVSYNNNVNLLGYIFDDVFPLYNFKRQKLDSYDIKFRLTDKDDKGANFIVKIDNVKMVVRATKHQMTMEVLI